MNTALLRFPPVLTPLLGLWRKLAPGKPILRQIPPIAHVEMDDDAIFRIAIDPPKVTTAIPLNTRSAAAYPLRVVHVLEAGLAPTRVRRMKISGRMADVCAELDRLAAREALLH